MNELPPNLPPPPPPPPVPPLPLAVQPVVPDYGTGLPQDDGGPGGDGKQTFGQQAAKASLVAPLVAFGITCLGNSSRDTNGSSLGIIFAITNALLILAGFSLAIAALASTRRRPAPGVVRQAVLGLIVNTLILALAGYVAFGVLRRLPRAVGTAGPSSPAVTPVNMGVLADKAFVDYDGWMGVRRVNGTLLVICELNDTSEYAKETRKQFTQGASFASVVVNNTTGRAAARVDVDTLVFYFANKPAVHTLRSRDFLLNATRDRESWLTLWGSPWLIPAQGRKDNGMAILPLGTRLRDAVSAQVTLNGEVVTIPGRLYTAQEKAALVQKAQTTQPSN